MNISYIALVIGGLSYILPKLGVQVSSADLTTTVSTIITLVSGIVALIHTKSSNNLTVLGQPKQ